MKFVKYSLATIMALSSSAFAADTLVDAFKEGKVSGQIQAYYWDRDDGKNATKDADIVNFGLDLSYETARFHGFGLKATFQSSSSPFIDDDAKEIFKGDMHGSGASLSEMYLSYAYDKTTIQAGRMYIATPLVYGSGSRMNKEAFEGALITNSNIPDTKLTLVYVDKKSSRTDGNGNFGKFDSKNLNWQGDAEDGAYSFVVQNSSIPNVNLTFAYLDAEDLMKATYTEVSFKKGIFGLAAQHYYSDVDANKDSADLFGVKANLQLDKLGLVAAYTTTSGGHYVNSGLGNGADYGFAWSNVLGDVYTADTDSYKIGANYQILPSLNVGLNYVLEDKEKANKKVSITGVSANYKFSGSLEGLNAVLMYDKEGKDGSGTNGRKDELRLNLVYSF